jgi:hypothetical protein
MYRVESNMDRVLKKKIVQNRCLQHEHLPLFIKVSNIKFHKILPVGAELLHARGQTGGKTKKYDEASMRLSRI